MATRDKSARVRARVLPVPTWHGNLATLNRLLPSGRSLACGFGLIALAIGMYAGARTTGVFAVRTVEVRGAGPADAARVRRAVAPLIGTRLLALRADDLRERVLRLPEIASVSFDRAYPHTLRLSVVPELPVVVLRRGTESWLVAGDARVIRRIPPGTVSRLPRAWVPRATDVERGRTLDPAAGGSAARGLAVLRGARFAIPVSTVRTAGGSFSLSLRNGLELRFGDPSQLRLKLAVARRALPFLSFSSYLDVSVPQRPVSGSNTQLAG